MVKLLIKRIYKYCVKHKWEIGFLENTVEDILDGQKPKVWWVKHCYRDRWFADPFILSEDQETITLLVEEYYDPIELGRIAKLVIDKKSHKIVSNSLVLQLDTHLSFPAILRKNGKIYIYPENFNSGKLLIYEYLLDSNTCQLVDVFCDAPLTDAIYRNIEGCDYIFSTDGKDPNGKMLGIYSKNENGQFMLTANVNFSENIARMAGDFFTLESNLYRPAQESNTTYGHSISIQKVSIDEGCFLMKEVVRIPSPHKIHKLGFHTFNKYGETVVVDVKGFRRPVLGNICYFLKHLVGLE